MMNPDVARCSNEDCPKRNCCARFDLDASYYADFAIGIDGKCDGFIGNSRKTARKAAVGSGSAAEPGEGRSGGRVKPWIGAI